MWSHDVPLMAARVRRPRRPTEDEAVPRGRAAATAPYLAALGRATPPAVPSAGVGRLDGRCSGAVEPPPVALVAGDVQALPPPDRRRVDVVARRRTCRTHVTRSARPPPPSCAGSLRDRRPLPSPSTNGSGNLAELVDVVEAAARRGLAMGAAGGDGVQPRERARRSWPTAIDVVERVDLPLPPRGRRRRGARWPPTSRASATDYEDQLPPRAPGRVVDESRRSGGRGRSPSTGALTMSTVDRSVRLPLSVRRRPSR